jgi:hypothetical protein
MKKTLMIMLAFLGLSLSAVQAQSCCKSKKHDCAVTKCCPSTPSCCKATKSTTEEANKTTADEQNKGEKAAPEQNNKAVIERRATKNNKQ